MTHIKWTAESLLEAALVHVESESIRNWSTSNHNKPVFLKIAQTAIDKNSNVDEHNFAAYIVACAIGLLD